MPFQLFTSKNPVSAFSERREEPRGSFTFLKFVPCSRPRPIHPGKGRRPQSCLPINDRFDLSIFLLGFLQAYPAHASAIL